MEALLEEKKTFDISTHFEKLGVGDGEHGWREPGKTTDGELWIDKSRCANER